MKPLVELFGEHVKSDKIRLHCLEVATIMRALAKELGEDEEKWAAAGLAHDMDCELTPGIHEQGRRASELMRENGFSDDVCHAILAHNEENLGVKRESRFDYALSAADNVSGMIFAYGLMRHSLDGMDAAGLKKKMKDKRFAETVRRDLITDIEKAGMPFDKFLEVSIKAMQSIAKEIGF